MRVKSIGITFLTVFAGVVALTVLGAVKPWQKGEKPKEFGCFSWSEEIIEEEENEALSSVRQESACFIRSFPRKA